MSTTTKQLREITLSKKATIIINRDINDKIKYLCKKINKVEWSGLLMFTSEESNGNITCTIKDVYLMDIGTAGHTQFKYDNDEIIDAINNNPQWMENGYRMGLIHSHAGMGVFFSSEDMDELHDNAKGTDFYLSLIVNNANDMIAKIVMSGEQKIVSNTILYLDNFGTTEKSIYEQKTSENSYPTLFIINCDILLENESAPEFKEIDSRISHIHNKNSKMSYSNKYAYGNKRYKGRSFYDDYDDTEYYKETKFYNTPKTTNKNTKKDTAATNTKQLNLYNEPCPLSPLDKYRAEKFLLTILAELFSKYGCSKSSSIQNNFSFIDEKLSSAIGNKLDRKVITAIFENILYGETNYSEMTPLYKLFEKYYNIDAHTGDIYDNVENVIQLLEWLCDSMNYNVPDSMIAFTSALYSVYNYDGHD